MKSLCQYIKDHESNHPFTVAGTSSSKLLIFDVDDTLIHTTAQIHVVKNGTRIKTLSNSEFNTYKLKRGEDYDFSEFNDEQLLNNETFTHYWNTFKNEYKKGTHIAILTARSIGGGIKRFFLKHGIDIKDELVFAVGDPNYEFSGSIQERKAKTIEALSKIGYKTFVFFDDNEENLRTAKALEKEHNIKIHTVKA